MANDNSTPEKTEGSGALRWILIAALLIALGLGGYFYMQYQQRSAELVTREKTDSVHIEHLDSMYSSTLASLVSYKGLNRQLDSIIAVRENELKQCRSEFLAEVRKNKITVDNYKKQIAEMHNVDSTFQSQITQLQARNKLLKISKDSLGRFILVQNDSMKALNDSVASLSKKVLLASLLKPTNITVASTHTKKNNKDASTHKASKTDQLKICFDVPQNDVARADSQVFQIRIIDPNGEILSGSTAKSFMSATSGESIPYSMSDKIQYKNTAAHTCAYFRAQVTYTTGDYTVEIYQKGYLVGTQKFTLK